MCIKDVLYINRWYNETKKNNYQRKIPKMNYGNLPFLVCVCNLCMFTSSWDEQLGLDSYCYNTCLRCTKPPDLIPNTIKKTGNRKKSLKSNCIYGTHVHFSV